MAEQDGNLIEKYDERMRPNVEVSDDMRWYDPKSSDQLEVPFRIDGLAWFRQEQQYRRLPLKPQYGLPEAVDYLANHAAGGQIRFQTDSSRLSIRVKLAASADMPHMPATGQCGFDCYIEYEGEMMYCNTAKFSPKDDEYEIVFFKNYRRQLRNIVLYFPLYQEVKEVLIGIDEDAAIKQAPDYSSAKKVIIYGTSITQGGCATRSGMAYSNILSRKIDAEFINLGFSGSGKGEPELAQIIADIADPGLFVLDYEANCVSTELLNETFPQFIRILRQKHPSVPILAVSKIPYSNEVFETKLRDDALERRELQMGYIRQFQEEGDQHIYFFDGRELLGEDDYYECTVDGVHPTDLGFLRMAKSLEPVVRALVQGE